MGGVKVSKGVKGVLDRVDRFGGLLKGSRRSKTARIQVRLWHHPTPSYYTFRMPRARQEIGLSRWHPARLLLLFDRDLVLTS